MWWTRLVTAVGVVAALTAPGCFCRKGPKVEKPVVRPVCLEASPRLNWFDGRANTLYVRVFQLSTPDAFLQADPSRLLVRGTVIPGVEGSPMVRSLVPGSKDTIEMRQHPDALFLGVVAGYFQLQGVGRTYRKLPGQDEEEDKKKDKDKSSGCIVFGPNAIEVP
jgi:type VI secretion system VasD/TssJ family lipoprotein